MLAKRLLPELGSACPDRAQAPSGAAMPEIVGMPVQGMPVQEPPTESMVQFGSTPGGPTPTVAGAPCGPALGLGGAAPADTGAPAWQGSVAGGGIVTTGMPVAGSVPDPEKGGGTVPKTV